MRPGGWLTLILSTALVWSLALWCYYRVFTAPPEEITPEPPDPTKT